MVNTDLAKPLGWTFLFVIFSSMFGGSFFMSYTQQPMVSESLSLISSNSNLLMTSIIVDMFTAMGIVTLGALLYLSLKKVVPVLAFIACLLFVLEAVSMVYSRFIVYQIMQLSLEFTQNTSQLGEAFYVTMGGSLIKLATFSYRIHFLFYCTGMLLFAYSIIRAKLVPVWIPKFGLLVVFVGLLGGIYQLMGNNVPLFLFLPILPYELVIGSYLVIKGFSNSDTN